MLSQIIKHSFYVCLLLWFIGFGSVEQTQAQNQHDSRTLREGQVDEITSRERWRFGRKPDYGNVKRKGRSGSNSGANPRRRGGSSRRYVEQSGNGSYYWDESDGNSSGEYVDLIDSAQIEEDALRDGDQVRQRRQRAPQNKAKAPEIEKTPDDDEASGVGTYLMYALIIAIVLGLVWYILKARNAGMFKGEAVDVAEESEYIAFEENIHEIEFEDEITRAVRLGNYRKAVRLRFLNVLKDLTDRGHIQWRINKTNFEYIAEIQPQTALKKDFTDITLLYEYIWYGEFTITEKEYAHAASKFDAFDAKR